MFAVHKQDQAKESGKPERAGVSTSHSLSTEPNRVWQSLALSSAGIQTKLAISQPDDPYEREADRVADHVMRTPTLIASTPRVQRKCTGCASGSNSCSCPEEGGLKLASQIATPQITRVQRQPAIATKAGGDTQTGVTGDTPAHPTSAESEVETMRGAGAPLTPSLRSFFEPRFGRDLSGVRVHTDARAAGAARSVNALAYTVGRNIVFGAGQYAPATTLGQKLIAHELTHVVQQDGPKPRSQSMIGDTGDANAHRPPAPLVTKAAVGRQVVQRFDRPPTPAEAEAARQMTRRIAERAAGRTAQRAGWRQFWRVVTRRFALRGATAAGLVAVDGPLPVGDLIALGLTIWMIYEIINLWPQLWQEAEQIPVTETQPQPQPAPETNPPPQPARPRSPRDRCFEDHPTAMHCDEPPHEDETRDEIVADFLMNEGYDFDDLGDCYQLGSRIPEGVIDDCNHAPAVRFHCRVNGTSNEVSIFACDCCDAEGNLRRQWSRPHWSVNQSQRGG